MICQTFQREHIYLSRCFTLTFATFSLPPPNCISSRLKSLSQHPNRTNAEVATESLILVSELLGVLDLEALVDGMIVAMFPLTPSTLKVTSPNSCLFSENRGTN